MTNDQCKAIIISNLVPLATQIVAGANGGREVRVDWALLENFANAILQNTGVTKIIPAKSWPAGEPEPK
jgi:hypothetical protein